MSLEIQALETQASLSRVRVFRSSTFRRTFLGFVLVWAICGGALFMLERSATRAVLLPLAKEAEGRIEDLLEEIAHQDPLDSEAEISEAEIFLGMMELKIPSQLEDEEYLEAYIEGLFQALVGESSAEGEEEGEEERHQAILIRLAILGERDLRGLEGLPIADYAELMFEEIPRKYHDALDDRIGEFEDRWEDVGLARNLTGPDMARVLGQARGDLSELLEEEDFCFELRGPTGEILLTNLGESTPSTIFDTEYVHFRTTTPEAFEDDWEISARHCLVKELRLGDGSLLRCGPSFDHAGQVLLMIPRIRNAALGSGLLVSLILSFLLARITVRFLVDLSRASASLQGGDVKTRIRRPGDRGDFDRAVSEINAMLEQLDGSVSTLTQVTDNIAHDLRTPLTRLQGQLDLLKRHPESAETMIEAVQDEVNQLLATFNALLRIAQVESAQRRRSFRTIDLVQIVDDMVELYAPVFAEQGLSFDFRLPEGPVRFFGDSNLWMQALSNLLDNALKYTPGGGRVNLSLMSSEAGTLFELRDTGPGIPETEMEKVFQRFYRLQKHRRERGTGLGLTLVAAICKLHGAPIELANDGGLVVHIRFPKFG